MGLLRRLVVPLLGLVAAAAPILTVQAARIAADESEFGEIDERHRDYKVETDLWCIALAVYHEGGSTTQARGQRGIARVVIERVLADLPQWGGRDICDVVFHKRGGVCGFSFACLPHAWRTPHGPGWQRAVAIAGEALLTPGEPENAIRYAMNPAITPDRDVCRFRRALVPVIGIGRHEFFRAPTEAEREALAASDPVECQRYRAAVAWKKKLANTAAKRAAAEKPAAKKRRKALAAEAKQEYAGK